MVDGFPLPIDRGKRSQQAGQERRQETQAVLKQAEAKKLLIGRPDQEKALRHPAVFFLFGGNPEMDEQTGGHQHQQLDKAHQEEPALAGLPRRLEFCYFRRCPQAPLLLWRKAVRLLQEILEGSCAACG